MDFDPRDIDSRQHERNGLDRDSDPREVFTRDLDLPGGLEREIVRDRDREYTLRGSESRTLATAPRVAIERIMRLDAVLTGPDLDWLTTRREKARFVFAADGTEAAEGVPVSSETVALTARAVAAGSFPIGIDSSGRVVLLYVATAPWTADFQRFLQDHAALMQRLPAWTLRLVFVQPNDRWSNSYRGIIDEELKTPIQPATITELKSHFERRRARGNDGPDRTWDPLDPGSDMFHRSRFQLLYRRWLRHGDMAFESVLSTATRDALVTGCGGPAAYTAAQLSSSLTLG